MTLAIGQDAPKFVSKDQNGKPVALEDYLGKKVVLYFYPKDSTPGCTAQAKNLRDHFDALVDAGYTILGVSTDSEKRHQNFIQKNDLPFSLISDEDQSVHALYGTWQLKKFMGKEYMGTVRTTFVIDEKGKISHIINKIKTKEHSEQILSLE
ncbi:thioredoxin-dependent thiol peroxidase [Marinomonas sp. 15G1-11]|uniref:thioredoxin-dependent peroxiredoxin n=1 Tax=Marinomonas phaeophyticola TaxID=3004091 RepID=A0ABT4JQW1_9GAMM|nr:thioredoxin-dependent thiol peroxidase [Marinomonas sp. 15G1-11]MCZ2720213.1 thioredoxin-dependent thiol peroxidase [Marinomonas sp. 15G1-11]